MQDNTSVHFDSATNEYLGKLGFENDRYWMELLHFPDLNRVKDLLEYCQETCLGGCLKKMKLYRSMNFGKQ